MIDRRTALRTIVGTLLGTSVASGISAAGSPETSARSASSQRIREEGQTRVAFHLTEAIERVAGIPTTAAPSLAGLERRLPGFSLGDVAAASGRFTCDSETVSRGYATVAGTFDPKRIEAALHDRDREFLRSTAVSEKHVYEAEGTPRVVAADDANVGIGTGRTRRDAYRELAEGQSTTRPRLGTDTGLDRSTLSGDARCVVSVGPTVRTAVRDRIQKAPDALEAVVESTRSAGIAVRAGHETSRVRYALAVDPDGLPDDVFEDLIGKMTPDDAERTSLSGDGSAIVADTRLPTDALWSLHEPFLRIGGYEITDNS